MSALVSAVKERRTSVIEALLDSGANVNFFAQVIQVLMLTFVQVIILM